MNRMGVVAVSTLAAVAFVGCKVGPNYQGPPATTMPAGYFNTPTTAPTTRSATRPVTTQPADVTQWWKTFADPALDALIARSVESNLDLRSAEARIREARALYGVARADLYPQVNVGANASRNRFSVGSSPAISGPGVRGISPEYSLFQAGFDASWELDVFGGNRRATEAARADIGAAVEGGRDVLVTLLSETARNYVNYRALQRRIALTNENIRSQQQTVELTRARFNAGLTSDLDVARAEAQVSTTRAQLPALEAAKEATLQTLGVLLGGMGDLRGTLDATRPIPQSPPRVPVGLPSDLLRRRPDVRRAERELAASTARIGVATADLFPKFTITGSLGQQSSQFKHIADAGSTFWSIGPGVSWPIFDAGRIRSNIRVQNARQEQAAANYEKTVLIALSDVETSLNAFGNEQRRRDELQDAVNSQQRAVDLANQLYSRGLGDFLSVLDAERALFASQDALALSDQAVSANLVSLYKAMGGGWELPVQDGAVAEAK
jgi:NodT family efflux transporter outer membrane factor (OMF) lipoprotein